MKIIMDKTLDIEKKSGYNNKAKNKTCSKTARCESVKREVACTE